MTDISRRSFLQGAAATAAAAAMSGGTALGADQPAKPRYSDPDKPLNIVCVGIGGMGGGGGGSFGVINENLDWADYPIDSGFGFGSGNGSPGSDGAPGCILVYY